jgi:hypothetical protein
MYGRKKNEVNVNTVLAVNFDNLKIRELFVFQNKLFSLCIKLSNKTYCYLGNSGAEKATEDMEVYRFKILLQN